MPTLPEVWLRGPVPDVPALLQPVVHAFLQAVEDVERAVTPLPTDAIWTAPGGAASVGFHCRHLAGATDRLLTYAEGAALSDAQVTFLKSEGSAGTPPATASDLVQLVREAMAVAQARVRATAPDSLTAPREVGRARLPTTVLGLLFHAAEHATRHAGQIVTTAKIVQGMMKSG